MPMDPDEQRLLDRALNGDLTPQELGQAAASFQALMVGLYRNKSLLRAAAKRLDVQPDAPEAVNEVYVEACNLFKWAIRDLPIHRDLLKGRNPRTDAELAGLISHLAGGTRLRKYRERFETRCREADDGIGRVIDALGEFDRPSSPGDLLRGVVATICCDARRRGHEAPLDRETRAVLRELGVSTEQIRKFLPDPGVPPIAWVHLLLKAVVARMNYSSRKSGRAIPLWHGGEEDGGGHLEGLISEARPVETPDQALLYRELVREIERLARRSRDPRSAFLLAVEAGCGPVVADREEFRRTLFALARKYGLSPRDLRLIRHRIARLRNLRTGAPLQLDVDQLAILFDVKPATVGKSLASARRQLRAQLQIE